jgi:hypothetical protein
MTREMTEKARCHYCAVNVGKNRLERARVIHFSQLSGLQESGTRVDRSGRPDPQGIFRRKTVVTNVAPNLARIVVDVEIMDRAKLAFDAEAERVETYVADFPEIPGS